jgi:hypothetical protein
MAKAKEKVEKAPKAAPKPRPKKAAAPEAPQAPAGDDMFELMARTTAMDLATTRAERDRLRTDLEVLRAQIDDAAIPLRETIARLERRVQELEAELAAVRAHPK